MVRGSVACSALLIAGCASAYRPPYGAPSWGFIERSRVNPSYEGIVIATSDYWCGVLRSRLTQQPEAKFSTFSECQRGEVGGPESHWLFSLPPGSTADVVMGASTRKDCDALRGVATAWADLQVTMLGSTWGRRRPFR